MSQARSPRPIADLAAHDAVERHWAVAAIPLATRRRARVAAERAWEGLSRREGSAADAAPLARRLTKTEGADVATVAAAYERAASEARQSVLAEGVVDVSTARATLRIAALESFQLGRVLPLGSEAEQTWHLVRLAALAVLGDAGADRGAWIEHAQRALGADAFLEPITIAVTQHAWSDVLQRQLPTIWLALLREPAPDAIDQPFEMLGRLREERADAEARQMGELGAADAAHLQMTLAGLYGVAEAAAILVSHMRRTMRTDVTARLDDAFTTAYAAVPATTPLGRALPWLHMAAVLIARRQSAQIALPGLLG